MSSLPELQRAFGEAVDRREMTPALAPWLAGSAERIDAGLAVYRGNVRGNLAQALAGAYPVVVELVGEDFFDALARDYARARPSTSGDLNVYGDGLAEFVAGHPHTQDLPYLPDLARLEWALHRAYYAADERPLAPGRLSALPAGAYADLRLVLAGACTLVASGWPIERIWRAHRQPGSIALETLLDGGPERVLVHRPGWQPRPDPVGPGDYAFLAALRDGAALGAALAAGSDAERDFDFAGALARWVGAGVIVDFVA